MEAWFNAASSGNAEYLAQNVDALKGTTNKSGSTALIRALYAHKLAAVEVLGKHEQHITDASRKFPFEIALKLRFYEACIALLLSQDNSSICEKAEQLRRRTKEGTVSEQELHDSLACLANEFLDDMRKSLGPRQQTVSQQLPPSCSEITAVDGPLPSVGKQLNIYAPASLSVPASNCFTDEKLQSIPVKKRSGELIATGYDVSEVRPSNTASKSRQRTTCRCL